MSSEPKVLTVEEMERVYSEISERQLFEHYDGLCRLGDSHEALRAELREENRKALATIIENEKLREGVIPKLRARVAELEAQAGQLCASLNAVAAERDEQAERIAELEAERDDWKFRHQLQKTEREAEGKALRPMLGVLRRRVEDLEADRERFRGASVLIAHDLRELRLTLAAEQGKPDGALPGWTWKPGGLLPAHWATRIGFIDVRVWRNPNISERHPHQWLAEGLPDPGYDTARAAMYARRAAEVPDAE